MDISNREKQVLNLLAYEYTTKEIADQLFLSAHTVGSHRKNLLSKLNVKNVAGLVRKGFKEGIIQTSLQNS